MINDVIVKKLQVHYDERGFLMEMLRKDDEIFKRFGQVYVSAVNKDVVKAWHMHHYQTDFVACVHGMIHLALYDERKFSPTEGEVNDFFIGINNPTLVVIPPGVQHGWKGLSDPVSLVVNCPDIPYDKNKPDEYRTPPHTNDIPFDWSRKDG